MVDWNGTLRRNRLQKYSDSIHMKTFNLVLLVFSSFFLAGCANPYSSFYTDLTQGRNITERPGFISSGEPKLYQGANPEDDERKMMEDGYWMVGYSLFHGRLISSDEALEQAIKAHAAVVLVYSAYIDTLSGYMPITTPTTQTSTTSANATAHSLGGSYVNAYGKSRTTTYGSTSSYVPYHVDRYDQFATYWAKYKTILGGISRELNDEERKKMGTNKGVVIQFIVKNSPAFREDFLVGDIIRQVENTDISDPKDISELLANYQGRTVSISLTRNGQNIVKKVKLDSR